MTLVPRIRLRTFFLVFVCAAVGLAIGTSPINESDPQFTIFGWQNAPLNWHEAFLGAASVAVVIGLVNEFAHLKRWQPRNGVVDDAALFARQFAMGWRLAIVGLLVACLATKLLLSGRMIQLPETETFFASEAFPNAVWMLCLIVVFSSSLSRWQRPTKSPDKGLPQFFAIGAAGLLTAALILPDVSLVHFLVHIATEGIEQAQPASHHWPGAFPDHRAEQFRSFWIAVVAIGFVVVAAATILYLNTRARGSRKTSALGTGVLVISLLTPAAYCVWYDRFEFHRISPYLASAGIGSNPLEWFAGVVLAATLITAGAYRVAAQNDHRFIVESNVVKRIYNVSLYESTACLLLLAASVLSYVFAVVHTAINSPVSFLMRYPLAEALVGMVQEPGATLVTVLLLICVQLGALRWRRRAEVVDWTLAGLESRRFFWNWVAIAALTCVAIPTISAFLFMFWLGPWYLYGP